MSARKFGKQHDTTDTTDFCPRQLVTDKLRTCYGENGVMDFGLIHATVCIIFYYFICNFIHRNVAKHKQMQLTMKNNNRKRYKLYLYTYVTSITKSMYRTDCNDIHSLYVFLDFSVLFYFTALLYCNVSGRMVLLF